MLSVLSIKEDDFLMQNQHLYNLCKIIPDRAIDGKLSIIKSILFEIGFGVTVKIIEDSNVIDYYIFHR